MRRAPDPSTYADPARYERQRAALARAWAYVGDAPPERTAVPARLLPGSVDEPLLLAHDGHALRALSNACTHRGALLLDTPCDAPSIRCPYHGRRFGLDGAVRAAPGFDPPPDEPLPSVPHARLGAMTFASLEPDAPFEALVDGVRDRLAFFDFDALAPDPASARTYEIDAHWALWCDNYLEGFHIPYVHPSLARTLDLDAYTVETFARCALQIGDAREGEPAFELPDGHPDAHRRVGGYYLFLFPLTGLNLYPWGVSLNAVEPLGPDRTRVLYRAYVGRPALRERGPGAALDAVEREDDAIVERAARGLKSRLYRPGRLHPQHEAAVAWFHDRLAELVAAVA